MIELEKRLTEEQSQLRQKLIQSIEITNNEYTRNSTLVNTTMRAKAETVAHEITERLATSDQSIKQRRENLSVARSAELQHVTDRLKDGVDHALARITKSVQLAEHRAPDWQSVLESDPSAASPSVDFIPVGSLDVSVRLRSVLNSPEERGSTPTSKFQIEYQWFCIGESIARW